MNIQALIKKQKVGDAFAFLKRVSCCPSPSALHLGSCCQPDRAKVGPFQHPPCSRWTLPAGAKEGRKECVTVGRRWVPPLQCVCYVFTYSFECLCLCSLVWWLGLCLWCAHVSFGGTGRREEAGAELFILSENNPNSATCVSDTDCRMCMCLLFHDS